MLLISPASRVVLPLYIQRTVLHTQRARDTTHATVTVHMPRRPLCKDANTPTHAPVTAVLGWEHSYTCHGDRCVGMPTFQHIVLECAVAAVLGWHANTPALQQLASGLDNNFDGSK